MKKFTINRLLAALATSLCAMLVVFQLNGASIGALRTLGQQAGRVTRVYFSPSRPTFAGSPRFYTGTTGLGGRFSSFEPITAADVRAALPALPTAAEMRSRFGQLPQEAWQAARETFRSPVQTPQGPGYGRAAINELSRLYNDQIRKDEKVLTDMYRKQDTLRGQLLRAQEALQNIDSARTTGSAWNTYADLSVQVDRAQRAFTEHNKKMVAQAELIQALKKKRFELQQK
jgi:hypothetical protein